jgi:hypothetical protein
MKQYCRWDLFPDTGSSAPEPQLVGRIENGSITIIEDLASVIGEALPEVAVTALDPIFEYL